MPNTAPVPAKLRAAVFARDGLTCQYCGTDTAYKLVIEHVVPRRLDGPNRLENLVVSCERCNQVKSKWVRLPSNFAAITAADPTWAAYVQGIADLPVFPMRLVGLRVPVWVADEWAAWCKVHNWAIGPTAAVALVEYIERHKGAT